MSPLEALHAARAASATEAAEAAERAVARVATARILAFVGALALLVAPLFVPALAPAAGPGAAAIGALFVVLVVVHARLFEARARARARRDFHARARARAAGDWKRAGEGGARFAEGLARHPYADDLDLFGPGSLHHRIDFTATRAGEDRLAAILTGAAAPGAPEGDLAAAKARQEAVADLEGRHDLREDVAVLCARLEAEKVSLEPLLAAVGAVRPFPAPVPLALAAAALPLAALTLKILAGRGIVPGGAWILPTLLGLGLLGLLRAPLAAVAPLGRLELPLGRIAELLDRVAAEPFEAPALVALRGRIQASNAARTLRRIGAIQQIYQARNNDVFRLVVAPLTLWELHFGLAFARLAAPLRAASAGLADAVDALHELDALQSLAAFSAEEGGAFPTFTDDARFEAAALAHPLLPRARRVANDVTLGGGGPAALLVTGSNMAGKSTLLRTVGVALVLARAGARVPAASLCVGPLAVATSMRVRDSLGDGVSRFYAEIAKLKIVLDARAAGPTLFLLDEVLHGTNSRERNLGARALVAALVTGDRPAIGLLSTHDLALIDLPEATGGRVANVHLRELVEEGKMTFDYRLRPGPVTTSNALRLMRDAGLPLPAEE